MIINNGLAERGNKIKLKKELADKILEQYRSDEDVIFSVEASGKGLKYQWEMKQSDGSFVSISGATHPKLRMEMITPNDNGKIFRCKIFNSAGTVYSNEVTLNVQPIISKPVINMQPSDVNVHAINASHTIDDKTAKITIDV